MMSDPLAAWRIDETEFPAGGSPAERIRFALRCAVLAPSTHNSQPWLFRVRGGTVELHADRTRALPVVDPEDRALTISCGAALFHLLTALRHFGETPRAELLPDTGGQPDLLARVELTGGRAATDEDHALFGAITARRTVRARFEDRLLPAELLAALGEAARAEGAWLHPADDEERTALAELIAQADYFQMHDRSFRRELAAWVHPNRSASLDGMPGYALGFGDLASYFGPLVIRTFDLGGGQAAKDRDLAAHSPALAVLGTDGDSALDWLRAGQALARVLLRARSEGVVASYLNQPIEVQGMRARVSEAIGAPGYPQLLFRLGYHDGGTVKPTPRRPVEAVLLPSG